MSAWYLLLPAFLVFLVGSAMSFSDTFRRSTWFIPGFTTANLAIGFLWIWAARLLDDKAKIYVFSLYWDSLMVLCYYILPLLAMGIKLNSQTVFGIVLTVIGLIVIKAYS